MSFVFFNADLSGKKEIKGPLLFFHNLSSICQIFKVTAATIFTECKHRNLSALVFDHYVTQIILPEKNPIRHMRWYVQIVQ